MTSRGNYNKPNRKDKHESKEKDKHGNKEKDKHESKGQDKHESKTKERSKREEQNKQESKGQDKQKLNAKFKYKEKMDYRQSPQNIKKKEQPTNAFVKEKNENKAQSKHDKEKDKKEIKAEDKHEIKANVKYKMKPKNRQSPKNIKKKEQPTNALFKEKDKSKAKDANDSKAKDNQGKFEIKANVSYLKKKKNRTDEKGRSKAVSDTKEVPYPEVSKEELEESKSLEPVESSPSLPMNALESNKPRQAWNANLSEQTSGRLKKPFPKSKQYRHYPVSCEFCNKKFQPGPLQKHIQEYHPDAHMPPGSRGKNKGKFRPASPREREPPAKKKAVGGMPRQMKICYICGRQFGSASLQIHEPKCLEKWRIENERLPKHKRMKEPEKPKPLRGADAGGGQALSGAKGGGYGKKLPDLDPEAEAAYLCHLRNLVACEHCGRRFNPDRVMRHEAACIERPRQKKKR